MSELAAIIITAIITFVATYFSVYGIFKRKLKAIIEMLVEVDKALQDDRVTEAEFRRIWEKFKNVVQA